MERVGGGGEPVLSPVLSTDRPRTWRGGSWLSVEEPEGSLRVARGQVKALKKTLFLWKQ